MMKKAVIFDLDGTLSDSIHSIKYSGDRTMEKFGYGPFTVEQYKYFVGDGARNLVRRALIAGGDTGQLFHQLEPQLINNVISRRVSQRRGRKRADAVKQYSGKGDGRTDKNTHAVDLVKVRVMTEQFQDHIVNRKKWDNAGCRGQHG